MVTHNSRIDLPLVKLEYKKNLHKILKPTNFGVESKIYLLWNEVVDTLQIIKTSGVKWQHLL